MPPPAPLPPSRYGLKGRVVTLAGGPELKSHVVYVDTGSGRIAEVLPSQQPAPAGFETAPVLDTRGTIYPGLIELHNHLCYNLLTLWKVPRQWEHRDQWPNHPDYLKLIRGPAQTLGNTHAAAYLAAIVRYVEAKCLVAGVTTSQGITLQGINTVARFRGNVRNVERPGHPALKPARARIGDLKPGEADDFLGDLEGATCLLLHLSEGQRANEHALTRFDRLQLSSGSGWAVTPALAGIHSAALREAELEILRENGGAIIWSPMSNLLLYGTTADVATAKAKGLRIGLGSDWSPSGSKNLLGELKVARLFSQNNGHLFTDAELVAMATTEAARILGWHEHLGRVQRGLLADLLVLRQTKGDPYARLIESTEADIGLVTIGGRPCYGRSTLLRKLAPAGEPWKVGRHRQAFSFEIGSTDNPIIVDLPLRQAADSLRDGLNRLPELAGEAASGGAGGFALGGLGGGGAQAEWRLSVDDDVDNAFLVSAAATVPYRTVAVPLELDPLTVVDDPNFLRRVRDQQPHVPEYLREGLADLYR